jgi:hypothetical protein
MSRAVTRLSLSLCLSVSLGAARVAFAGPPGAGYDTIEIGGSNELWVPSGDDEFCENDAPDEVCITSNDIATDGAGNVTGTGNLSVHFEDLFDGNTPLTFTGQTGGTAIKPKHKIRMQGAGSGILQTDSGPLSADSTVDATFNCENPLPHGPEFVCKGRAKLCLFAVGRHACSGGGVRLRVSAAGGPWTFGMEAGTDDDGKTVTANAITTLSDGSSSDLFAGAGKYNAKSDQSSLKFVSTSGNKDKISFSKVVVDDTAIVAGDLKFQVAGMKGRITLPLP